MSKTPVRFADLFRYYKGLPHQIAAVEQLGEQIPPELLSRDSDWFKTWSQAGKQPEPSWLEPALSIIREFEGLRLDAYQDAVGVWTIGYGTTRYPGTRGGPVRKGDSITKEQADEYLRLQVIDLFGPGVLFTIPRVKDWAAHRIAALVSWAYNVGLAAVESSTLARRLNAGEDPLVVIREELPRWDKADGKTLAGLTRRRNAEVALFVGQELQQPGRVTPTSPFATRLTPHFTVGEFALGQEARRFQHQYQVDTAAELAAFLERVRTYCGNRPITITSGFRPAAINRSVGGASGSEHLFSQPREGAADFVVHGADMHTVQAWVERNWPHSVGRGAARGFVHIGRRADGLNRRWDY